jgi:hypothetical protein
VKLLHDSITSISKEDREILQSAYLFIDEHKINQIIRILLSNA